MLLFILKSVYQCFPFMFMMLCVYPRFESCFCLVQTTAASSSESNTRRVRMHNGEYMTVDISERCMKTFGYGPGDFGTLI